MGIVRPSTRIYTGNLRDMMHVPAHYGDAIRDPEHEYTRDCRERLETIRAKHHRDLSREELKILLGSM